MKKSEVDLQKEPYCESGLIQLCKLLSFSPFYSEYKYRMQKIKQLYDLLESGRETKPLVLYQQVTAKFINGLYLIQLILQSLQLQHPILHHTVADKKVLKVLFWSYEIIYINSFIETAIWRNESIQPFIKAIKARAQSRIYWLKLQKISDEDLQCLYSTEKVFSESKENKQIYKKIRTGLDRSQSGEWFRSSIAKGEVTALFSTLVQKMYYHIGLISENSVLKLELLYLILLMNSSQKLSLKSPVTKIWCALKWRGYVEWQFYFQEVSNPKRIASDSNLLKS